MGQRIKHRRDTGANWTASNPVLLDGELGWDKTAKKAKMGDGVTDWNSLPYMTSSDYNDLTNKPDLSGYATMAAVNAAGFQTAAQVDTAITAKGYQTAAQVTTAIAAATIDGGNAAG